jgi:hypothetical protein
MADFDRLRDRYRRFAEQEAKGVSDRYEELARRVADSEPLLHFIASLPEPKQQPNLVFAAVRHLYGTPEDGPHLARLVELHAEPIRELILRRRTQTNEPNRCATLLPALAMLPQPLALIEVGASAGLCLLLDRYGYDYGTRRLEPRIASVPAPPSFPCRANAATPIPDEIPRIAWRAGLDLNPLDPADPADAAWLESLVWPGQEARAERLRQAVRLAADHPVHVAKGDLLAELPALAAAAPEDATLVVFHSAVLAYVSEEQRDRFAELVADLGAVWISNEAPSVLPRAMAKLARKPRDDRFMLSVDGQPVAFTSPHGLWIDWLA